MNNPYMKSKVLTADRGSLLIMLYDGAIRFNLQAIHSLEQDKPLESLTHMGRTLSIVQELQAMLDHRHAPELCSNLENLYLFIQDKIIKAQQEKSPGHLRDAEKILRDLREAWSQVVQQPASAEPIRRTG